MVLNIFSYTYFSSIYHELIFEKRTLAETGIFWNTVWKVLPPFIMKIYEYC